ncbi:apolipoprotein N-acyltransferase [Inhella inkyongensis]|uniref:Apolipoprotein N-acyltransferase n=1 Tax=Inhella inkyongensis TaxID=392593 RepID=A0A840S271_9BURK|nr:apolipoprotein N-acyltransferase [Inhella inkyongensis]MBB5203186.1 apolipoprotein N-acyltransferase [Inhella inkyongensis]
MRVWSFAAALGAGALQVLAFAPFGFWLLQPLALSGLLLLAAGQGVRRAAGLGAAFGLGWFGAGLWWLFISLHEFGGLPAPLAVLALLLLGAFLSLYPAAALALHARLRPSPRWAPPLFAVCWLAAELARAQWFTGFPWIAGGYAHTAGPWAGWAPWVGVYGIGFLTAWAAAALLQPRSPKVWLAPLALALLGLILPQDFSSPAGRLQLHLLQPNVAQSHKFDPARIERQLSDLLDQIEQAPPGLVLAPESVLPVPLALMDVAAQQRIADLSRARPLLLGSFVGSNEAGWVNTLMGWQGGELRYLYGKRHLLPFGEFIPPGFEWFVRALNIPMDSQATGLHQRPWVLGGQRLRPLICYEDLFGEDMVASALSGPDAATVFVNASNLAWFGRLMVQDQHLQFSQMRALEFQRPVVRSTNTGATAWVDHRGQVRARLAPEQVGVLSVEVEGRAGATPYARWLGALGLRPLWALALLPLIGVALRRRLRRSP